MNVPTPKCILPNECLEIILDHLHPSGRAHSLFTLLTVDKRFFHLSASRLYSHPIQILQTYDAGRVKQKVDKLFALILRCSPAQDTDVQRLREVLADQLLALSSAPIFDYLTYIKSMTYSSDVFDLHPLSAQNTQSGLDDDGIQGLCRTNLFATIVWAACGHRLDQMLHIDIPCRALERYHLHVDKMTTLKSMWLYLLDIPEIKYPAWSETKTSLVRKDVETLSHFMDRWSAAYRKRMDSNIDSSNTINDNSDRIFNKINNKLGPCVDIQLVAGHQEDDWWSHEPFAEYLTHIFRQMPPFAGNILCTDRQMEWARFSLAPETMNLPQLAIIDGYVDIYGGPWPWPGQGKSWTLKQCRRLRSLTVMLAEGDDDLFEWAVEERQQLAPSTSPTSAMTIDDCHQLVQLEDLTINPRHCRKQVPKPWKDAISAFRSTLETLVVGDTLYSHDLNISVFNNLPNVHHIHLEAWDFSDDGLEMPFLMCPSLTELILETSARDNRTLLAPWSLPTVTHLQLAGSVMSIFDQATFATMISLYELVIKDVFVFFSWNTSIEWSLPSLEILCLSDFASQADTSMSDGSSILERCPRLEVLELIGSSELRPSERECFAYVTPLAVSTSTKHLLLQGWFFPDDMLFRRLPHLFPNLETLVLHYSGCLSNDNQDTLKALFPFLIDFEYKENGVNEEEIDIDI